MKDAKPDTAPETPTPATADATPERAAKPKLPGLPDALQRTRLPRPTPTAVAVADLPAFLSGPSAEQRQARVAVEQCRAAVSQMVTALRKQLSTVNNSLTTLNAMPSAAAEAAHDGVDLVKLQSLVADLQGTLDKHLAQ